MSWYKPAWFKATFLEDDGSLAMAEINTSGLGFVVLVRAVVDCFHRDQPFPYITVCSSVGLLIVAYEYAKLVRSGKWKPGDVPPLPTAGDGDRGDRR